MCNFSSHDISSQYETFFTLSSPQFPNPNTKPVPQLIYFFCFKGFQPTGNTIRNTVKRCSGAGGQCRIVQRWRDENWNYTDTVIISTQAHHIKDLTVQLGWDLETTFILRSSLLKAFISCKLSNSSSYAYCVCCREIVQLFTGHSDSTRSSSAATA